MKKQLIFISLITLSLYGEDFNFETAEEVELNVNTLTEKKVIDKKEVLSNTIIEENEEVIIDENASSIFGSTSDDIIDIENTIEINKDKGLKLKNYSEVSYVKGYDWFSITPPTEESFNDKLMSLDMDFETFESLLKDGKNLDGDMLYLSALYYDFVRKEPNLAENYYLLFKKSRLSRVQKKIALADFLIRTGRYKGMKELITAKDIYAYIGCRGWDFQYYKGVLEYLNTGNKKNKYLLKAARCGVSKAKHITK